MARLPTPGGDSGNWGDILNEYLSQALKTDGTIKDNAITANNIAPNSITAAKIATDAVGATQIADGSVTEPLLSSAVQTKLNQPANITDGSIAKAKLSTGVQSTLDKADSALQSAPVTKVNNQTGDVTLARADVGLGNVDNTADSAKPVSTAQQAALDEKVSMVSNPSVLYGTDYLGEQTLWQAEGAPTNWTLAQRDGSGNLKADAFIPSATSTATSGGTTTLTVDSTETQIFTGSSAHTVVLPTTGIVAGQRYTLISQSSGIVAVNSSDGSQVGALAGTVATYMAVVSSPTGTTDWIVSGMLPIGGLYVDAGVGPWTAAQRTNEGNLKADAFIPSATSTATANGTTTLTIDSKEVQIFTGSLGQTLIMPTTGIKAGQRYTVINNSSGGNIQINASGGNSLIGLNATWVATLTAKIDNPTVYVDWAVVSTPGTGGWQSMVSSAYTVVQRTAEANVLADAFIPSLTSTATAAGSTTLTVDSTEVQLFTGTMTQTVILPTTNVAAGQRFTIVNTSLGNVVVNASGGGLTDTLFSSNTATLVALQAAPTLPAHWAVIGNFPTSGSYYKQAASAFTLVQRDAQSNITSDAFIPGSTATATAAGTTTLTVDDTEVQIFTGTTTQTVTLPSTGIVTGQSFTVINQSSGQITVNASGGSLVKTIASTHNVKFVALQAAPTAAAHWTAFYFASFAPQAVTGTFTIPVRDAQANLSADAFIPGITSTATAAGTTTLTNNDTEVQVFTGTAAQTVLLPTTGVVAGQRYTIISQSTGIVTVQSSGANTIQSMGQNYSTTFIALVASPTTAAQWAWMSAPQFGPSTSGSVNSMAQRNGTGMLFANSFIPSLTSTATAAGTTTLTNGSNELQVFTGTTTQTVALPTTSIAAGQRYTVVNTSTGIVTVNSSGGNLVATVQASSSVVITALQATPTTAAHWAVVSTSSSVTTSTGAVSNTIAQRNASANLQADVFIPSLASTATSAITTTLTVDSVEVQVFTGTTTQIVALPTTGIVAGHGYKFINQSTGPITINASGGATLAIIEPKATLVINALIATPTTVAHWAITGGNSLVAQLPDANSLWAVGNSESTPRYALAIQGAISGAVTFSYFTAPIANTVSKLGWAVNTATSSGTTLCRLGIYTVASNGDMTLVARTANVTTLGNTADALNSASLDATGGFVTSYTYIPGQRYAHALIQVSSNPAAMATNFPLGVGATQTSPILASVRFSQTDLATSHTAAQVANYYHQPWIAGIV